MHESHSTDDLSDVETPLLSSAGAAMSRPAAHKPLQAVKSSPQLQLLHDLSQSLDDEVSETFCAVANRDFVLWFVLFSVCLMHMGFFTRGAVICLSLHRLLSCVLLFLYVGCFHMS